MDNIFINISILHRNSNSFITDKLKEYGQLSIFYLVALVVHENSGVSQDQIASLLKYDKATITNAAKKLESEGYLRREVDASDRRFNRIYPTAKTTTLIPEIYNAMQEWKDMISKNISKESFEDVQELLSKMAKNINPN